MSGNSSDAPISVIVVEDEAALRDEVVAFLSARGMAVRAAADGPALWREFDARAPDVVVLDLGLPGEDGIAIAAELRRRAPAIGIVMTTARGAVQDRIVGYEIGANVYLVKPVDLGELVAAIRATLRRGEAEVPVKPAGSSAWKLDLTAWRLAAPDGRAVQLTRAEMQVLGRLTEGPGMAVSRAALGRSMGKVDDLSEYRYVDQVIRRLRRKIETQLDLDPPIGAAHSQGYYFMQAIERVRD